MPSSRSERRGILLALIGYGRMGREVERTARGRGHTIGPVLHPTAPRAADRRITKTSLRQAEVAIEFTRPDAAVKNIEALARAGCRSIVVGTTGWKHDLPRIEALAGRRGLGIVHADNFSPGMALFSRIVGHAAGLLAGRGGYDPYVVEWHHRGKRDSPSGTARLLAGVIETAVPGRKRHEGLSPKGLPESAFHVASVRAGAIPGTHLVGFESDEDAVELRHVARGRAGFALGAVLAAEWIRDRTGVFTFDDVLGSG